MLRNKRWEIKYTPEHGDLVAVFYVPALKDATRYDRLTGYFSASALALAARGIEGLVGNNGRMRLIVGCTLDAEEIAAIDQGAHLRDQVEKRLERFPLDPKDEEAKDALALLTWMIAHGHLDVKVAVPCDKRRRPVPQDGIFHEKAGIIADGAGDRLAWNGSLNETAAGWKRNWESINVYTSWGADLARVEREEHNFERLWADNSTQVIVMGMPEAMRRDLMRFMPKQDRPARLREEKPEPLVSGEALQAWKDRVWSFVWQAAARPDGECVGEATAAIKPWPHQVRAFQRMYDAWPPRLLIADEVGLGKTIQAGMLLRQAWLAGRARRILILTPKAVLNQWQVELREKFNLNWPIYDGRRLIWHASPQRREQPVERDTWHNEPFVLASSHLIRRKDRAREVCEQADRWDLIVLDEAHHARRKGAGSWKEGGPNNLLSLMQRLTNKCDGLLLLTATPMQVAPVEVWDLLNLLGLPTEWTEAAFLDFFKKANEQNTSSENLVAMAKLFRSVEQQYGEASISDASHATQLEEYDAKRVLRALRDGSTIPIRRLDSKQRLAAVRLMRANTPIRRLVSRHTRALLRAYHQRGLLSTPIARRIVKDCFIEMTPQERVLYERLEDYIRNLYQRARKKDRAAVGLVMVIYRRRLASSFRALQKTLEKRLHALEDGNTSWTGDEEDVPDDEVSDEMLDAEALADLEQQALSIEQQDLIQEFLEHIKQLPPDGKVATLKETIDTLRAEGYSQVMVFTQYTDTLDFLREDLGASTSLRLMCFSGRGGEVPEAGDSWRPITRYDAKKRFRNREADVLLCSEAAAEGLNFQFCGALINYDMPWNPMRVEQRIGRIDRLGQEHAEIKIINLHYNDTVETDVYRVLRTRIRLFEDVVGRLQPILSRLSGKIWQAVLEKEDHAPLAATIATDVDNLSDQSFDLDTVTDEEMSMPQRASSPITMGDLERIIRMPALLPEGVQADLLGPREYKWSDKTSQNAVRVTTDPKYYEKHADSVVLWSPGSTYFVPQPATPLDTGETSLTELLNQHPGED